VTAEDFGPLLRAAKDAHTLRVAPDLKEAADAAAPAGIRVIVDGSFAPGNWRLDGPVVKPEGK